LITGTPGVGKTTTCEALAAATGLNHLEVGKLVREKKLHDGWDEEFQTHILNEDKICDELEDIMTEGGNIVDFHTSDFFPERWFDLVIVLRADTSQVFSRLEKTSLLSEKN